jgi:CheY-like chemotaxis protein
MAFDTKTYVSETDFKAAQVLAKEGEGAVSMASESGNLALEKRAQLASTLYLRSSRNSSMPPSSSPELMTGEGNVVIIDDDGVLRLLTQRMVSKLGYKVEVFNDARDVLHFFEEKTTRQAFRPEEVDLVISDIVMPGISGAQLAKELAQKKPGLKILLVSADAPQLHEIDEDKQPFIRRPFRHHELAETVKRLIEGQGNGEQNPIPK